MTVQPISIDVRRFANRAGAPDIETLMQDIRGALKIRKDVRIGLGIDRLDYTKGLRKKIAAIDRFFTKHRHYRGRFTFVQIGVTTRGDLNVYRRYRGLVK